MTRRLVLLLIGAGTVLALWLGTATPAHAIVDDIKAFCGPIDVPSPSTGGSGVDSFLPGRHYDTNTYLPRNYQGTVSKGQMNPGAPGALGPSSAPLDAKVVTDINAWEQGKYGPSYHRYGFAGLTWNAWGDIPGCFSLNRWFGFIPNLIFSVSKLFAGFTLSLIQWSFQTHPFAFLEPAIGSLATATSSIAATFLGILGVAGAMYLWWKNWGPHGRLSAVLKGVGWMLLVLGAFFWFQANPMKMASNVTGVANDLTGQAFSALSDLPTSQGGVGLCKAATNPSTTSQEDVTTCVQDAFWVPLVYQPWLFGEFGNNTAAQALWGPQLLNAQFVGTGPDGRVDADGKDYISSSYRWNAFDEIGGGSKHGDYISGEALSGGGPKLIPVNPWLQFWGYDVCAVYAHDAQGDMSSCWNENGRKSGLLSENPQLADAAQIAMGSDFSTRMDAAWMSAWGGIVINLTVWFICAMLLATKLALLVLMVFAPIYLMLGAFPGPSRVAAIKLAEMLFANLVRQVSWGLALVLVAYLDTMIMASQIGWFWKVSTCALATILLAIYARPAMRAISGLAVGNKEAGGHIEGVMSNAMKTGAKTAGAGALAVGLAGAGAYASTKSASQAAASSGTTLTTAERFKAAALGITRAVPNTSAIGSSVRGISTASDAGRLMKKKTDMRAEEKLRAEAFTKTPGAAEGLRVGRLRKADLAADRAAQVAADNRRQIGDQAGAAAIDKGRFDRHLDKTRRMHPEDPWNPAQIEANRLTRSRDSLGQAGQGGVRRSAIGSELASKSGLPTALEASKNIDRTAGMFGGTSRIDPTHQAGPALREFAAQTAAGAVDEQARSRAIEAVATYGVPDQIEKIGLPASTPPMDSPDRLRSGVRALAPLPADATPQQRIEHAARLEALAQRVPVGSQLNTALNDWRELTLQDSGPATRDQQVKAQERAIAAAAALTGEPAPIPPMPTANGLDGVDSPPPLIPMPVPGQHTSPTGEPPATSAPGVQRQPATGVDGSPAVPLPPVTPPPVEPPATSAPGVRQPVTAVNGSPSVRQPVTGVDGSPAVPLPPVTPPPTGEPPATSAPGVQRQPATGASGSPAVPLPPVTPPPTGEPPATSAPGVQRQPTTGVNGSPAVPLPPITPPPTGSGSVAPTPTTAPPAAPSAPTPVGVPSVPVTAPTVPLPGPAGQPIPVGPVAPIPAPLTGPAPAVGASYAAYGADDTSIGWGTATVDSERALSARNPLLEHDLRTTAARAHTPAQIPAEGIAFSPAVNMDGSVRTVNNPATGRPEPAMLVQAWVDTAAFPEPGNAGVDWHQPGEQSRNALRVGMEMPASAAAAFRAQVQQDPAVLRHFMEAAAVDNSGGAITPNDWAGAGGQQPLRPPYEALPADWNVAIFDAPDGFSAGVGTSADPTRRMRGVRRTERAGGVEYDRSYRVTRVPLNPPPLVAAADHDDPPPPDSGRHSGGQE